MAVTENSTSSISRLRELLRGDPLNADAYRALAAALDEERQKEARTGAVTVPISEPHPDLLRASAALQQGDLETAEIILRRWLLERPGDAVALWMMARLAIALAYEKEGEALLRLAIELRPDLGAAGVDLARGLEQRGQAAQALEILDDVIAREPGHLLAKSLKASNLSRVGRFEESLGLYEELLRDHADEAALWTGYGHVLKTMGRSADGAKAMRRAVEIAPRDGEAWWNVANLKTAKFTRADVDVMLEALRETRPRRTGFPCTSRWARHSRISATARVRSAITRKAMNCGGGRWITSPTRLPRKCRSHAVSSRNNSSMSGPAADRNLRTRSSSSA